MDIQRIFEETYTGLFRYCHRMTGDADAAEDVAQEAFVRLWDHRVEGETPAVRAWLYKVATHLIRDRVKVGDNRRRLLEIHPVSPSQAEDPAGALERSEEIARVRRILDGLEERECTLLMMRQEGFSYQEIAEVVGVAPASVGTLLARAMRRFTDAYGAQHHADIPS